MQRAETLHSLIFDLDYDSSGSGTCIWVDGQFKTVNSKNPIVEALVKHGRREDIQKIFISSFSLRQCARSEQKNFLENHNGYSDESYERLAQALNEAFGSDKFEFIPITMCDLAYGVSEGRTRGKFEYPLWFCDENKLLMAALRMHALVGRVKATFPEHKHRISYAIVDDQSALNPEFNSPGNKCRDITGNIINFFTQNKELIPQEVASFQTYYYNLCDRNSTELRLHGETNGQGKKIAYPDQITKFINCVIPYDTTQKRIKVLTLDETKEHLILFKALLSGLQLTGFDKITPPAPLAHTSVSAAPLLANALAMASNQPVKMILTSNGKPVSIQDYTPEAYIKVLEVIQQQKNIASTPQTPTPITIKSDLKPAAPRTAVTKPATSAMQPAEKEIDKEAAAKKAQQQLAEYRTKQASAHQQRTQSVAPQIQPSTEPVIPPYDQALLNLIVKESLFSNDSKSLVTNFLERLDMTRLTRNLPPLSFDKRSVISSDLKQIYDQVIHGAALRSGVIGLSIFQNPQHDNPRQLANNFKDAVFDYWKKHLIEIENEVKAQPATRPTITALSPRS